MQFTFLKRATRPADVLISCSIFKMDPTVSYRDFFKYENALHRCIKASGMFNIRIYIDYTTTYLVNKYIKESHVEFVLYKSDMPNQGTLGSTVRFHPCFEWPDGYKYVWVSDIDLSKPNIFSPYFISDFIKSDAIASYVTFPCYDKPWINVHSPIINYRFICRSPFPINIFNDYLHDLASDKFDSLRNILIKHNAIHKRGVGYSLHPYGMDEYFTNTILMPYLIKHKLLIETFITTGTIIPTLKYSSLKDDKDFLALVEKIYEFDYFFYTNNDKITEVMITNYIDLVKKIPSQATCLTDFVKLLSHPMTIKHIMINVIHGKGSLVSRVSWPIA